MLRESDDRRSDVEALLTPGEVATLFGVDPTTVANWAKSGKLQAIKTLGGHRRFRAAEVQLLFAGGDFPEGGVRDE